MDMECGTNGHQLHAAYLSDHRRDGLRSGEGSIETLDDGRLLLVYGRFEGPGDADRATLMERFSADGGITWTDPQVFLSTPVEAQNLMSVGLLRLADGRIGAVYCQKNSLSDCRPRFMAMTHAGGWSDPVEPIPGAGYHVVNNDRLVQLAAGRLLVPFADHGESIERRVPSRCGCVYSDDGGMSWQKGHTIRIEPENIRRPRLMDPNNPDAERLIAEGGVHAQEPGVIELTDGRLMMWARSNGGYAYRAFSDDGGIHWSPFEAIPEFAMPNGPQSIKRLPSGRRLIMLFNDRGDLPFGSSQFQWRRPLTLAVSDDDGATWRRHGWLESDTLPSHCYYSIAFHRESALFTYYEGVMKTDPSGLYRPRNLSSLKLRIVRLAWFEQG